MDSFIGNLENILQTWEQTLRESLPKVLLSIVIFLLFFIFAKLVRIAILKSYFKTINIHPAIAHIIASFAYFFLIFSGTFLALQVIGLEKILSNLLAGAGIVGIIAGFAFKDVASNIFAGLLLKLQAPFKKDDWVRISNNYGEIIQVGWITTSLKTIAGQEVFVPNQIIYSNAFSNYSAFNKRKVSFEIGLSAAGNDLEHVKVIALDEVQKMEQLLPNEEAACYFTNIDNSAFKLQINFWIRFNTDKDFCQAMDTIILRIKKRFDAENIKMV